MLENIIFLSMPITACVLLAGILGYFGNHILTRGIIFIDIAFSFILYWIFRCECIGYIN